MRVGIRNGRWGGGGRDDSDGLIGILRKHAHI